MSVSESDKECPLCMEALDWDDLGFFPCSCGYQICRFCWHRLRTDENGLCPACRQAFPDMPVSFNPEISAEELKKQKKRNKEKKSNKDQAFKPQDLATLRVVQKNLVFVIGLSSRLTQEDLKKEFAHFGKIIKFVHNKSTAYITYSKPEEAIRAIRTLNASAAQESVTQQLQFQSQLSNGNLASNTTSTTTTTTTTTATATTTPATLASNILSNTSLSLNSTKSFLNAMSVPVVPNRLKASLGTTKYCNHFLRSQQCPKVGECMYLHEIAEAEASFTKEQMQAGKHVEYEKKLMDSYLTKLEWQSNQPSQNGFRVSRDGLSIQQQQVPNQHHQTLAQQISSQLGASQISPSSNNSNSQPNSYGQRQPNANQMNIPMQTNSGIGGTHNNGGLCLNPNLNQAGSNGSNNNSQPLSGDLSPNHLTRTYMSPVSLQQSPKSDHSPTKHLVGQHRVLSSRVNMNSALQSSNSNDASPVSSSLSMGSRQQHPQQHQQQQQQQQQLVIDTDSEDDGLDFDPISVSTSGLRDLLDQQVQQAKQMQMQNYIQQMNTNQSLANVLFQQTANNRLNHHPSNGLINDTPFNGHPQSLASLAGLTANTTTQQPQVTWQNLNAWSNFIQRSGYGFENGR